MKRAIFVLCAGCGAPPEATCDGPAPGEEPVAAVVSAITERFDAGVLSVVGLGDLEVCDGVTAVTGDTVVRAVEGRVVQIDRFRYDRIRVIEPGRWGDPIAEFSVGRNANPHDVVRCGGAWLVSLYEEPALGVFDDRGNRVASVDLSDHADPDGIPEASGLVVEGERAFVALERLSRTQQGFLPEESGRIVEVDCQDWETRRWVEVSPNAQIGRGDDGVIRAWGADGRLGILDPASVTVEWNTSFDRPVASSAFVEQGHGVALVRGESLWHELYCVDPSGAPRPLLATDAYLSAVRPGPDGQVWIAVRRGWASEDRQPEGFDIHRQPAAGLWRVDPEVCTLSERGSVELDLPPFSLAFY